MMPRPARWSLPCLTVAAALALPLSLTPSPPAAAAGAVPQVTKLLTIVEENRSQANALATMPYLRAVASHYGRTTNYRAITHPSLPNYLALAGGDTFGVTDDRGPSYHHIAGASVFDQALAHGRTATTYADGMPSACYLGYSSAAPRYAVRHNPWTYFSDPLRRSNCQHHDLPLGTTTAGSLATDVHNGTLPNVGLVIPDTCHDGHDSGCTASSDAWLKSWVEKVQSGPDWLSGRLAIVVTFDEDDSSSGNAVLTAVLSRYLAPTSTSIALSHYSWTRWADELALSPLQGHAANGPSLRTPFGL